MVRREALIKRLLVDLPGDEPDRERPQLAGRQIGIGLGARGVFNSKITGERQLHGGLRPLSSLFALEPARDGDRLADHAAEGFLVGAGVVHAGELEQVPVIECPDFADLYYRHGSP